jgi:arylsulfatase
MMSPQDPLVRSILPIPDVKHVGLTTYDAKDPDTKYPPITQGAAAEGRAERPDRPARRRGFAASSAFGGLITRPTAERLRRAASVQPFHTTACARPRARRS